MKLKFFIFYLLPKPKKQSAKQKQKKTPLMPPPKIHTTF